MMFKMGVKFSKHVSAKLSCFKEVKFPCCNENRSRRTIKINIFDLKSPLAYSSKQNVYREAKKHVNIRKQDVDLWFEKQLAPTLHKPVRFNF